MFVYWQNFAPFQDQNYDFFFSSLRAMYLCKSESVRKIDAQVWNFQYKGCLFGVEKLIWDKKVEKIIGDSYFDVKLTVCKDCIL